MVHVDHGIGRYRGLETITAMGAPHECLWLEYAGGDKLYLPVENIELLTRYGHEEGLLDRLGGGAWQAKKARLKARIRDMADRLIRLAAERALRKGAVLAPPDHHAWEEFCARFPYAETEDQLNAIADVLGDLESGEPMDRLVCGDVGFGKTEVALRAAYRRGDVGDAGGGDRADDAAGAPAFQELLRAVPRAAGAGAAALAVRARRRRRRGDAQGARPTARSRSSSAPTRCWRRAVKFREPRAARHRRGAALRRGAQGAAEGAALGRARADADRDADPAHAAAGAVAGCASSA